MRAEVPWGSRRTGKVLDGLEVVGVSAGHEGDGHRAGGAAPGKGDGLALLNIVIRVGEGRLGEADGGEDTHDGGEGQLHCEYGFVSTKG